MDGWPSGWTEIRMSSFGAKNQVLVVNFILCGLSSAINPSIYGTEEAIVIWRTYDSNLINNIQSFSVPLIL